MRIFKNSSFLAFSFLFLFVSTQVFAQNVEEQQTFSDVDKNHRYYNAISYLYEKGIIEGYEDGTFKPGKKINRAEMLKIALVGLSAPENTNASLPFPDIGLDAWYHPYVVSGLDLAIVKGYPDGNFRPENTINKVEALKMILVSRKINLPQVSESESAFFDDTLIDSSTLWYQPYLFFAVPKKIVEGENVDLFKPDKEMTRGEVAEILYRLLIVREQDLSSFDNSQQGIASYYGDSFEGKKTSSGDLFSQNSFSTAHRYFPFGTFLRVVNSNTGASSIVKVNDRGPYVDGRILDLSKSAMRSIASLSAGIAGVKSFPVGLIPGVSKTILSKEIFWSEQESGNLGVLLDEELPNMFFVNEIYHISGMSAQNESDVYIVLTDKTTNQQAFVYKVPVLLTRFQADIHFPQAGLYRLNIFSGNVGVGTADISVVDSKHFEVGTFLPHQKKPSDISIDVVNSRPTISWNGNGNNIFLLKFHQRDTTKMFYVSNTEAIRIPENLLEDFLPSKQMSLTIFGAQSSSIFTMDRSTVWTEGQTFRFTPVQREYEIYNISQVKFSPFSSFIEKDSLFLQGEALTNLSSHAYYTLPSGKVETLLLPDDSIVKGDQFSLSIPITEEGIYVVEVNLPNGEAAFNMPFYTKDVYPVLPNLRDLSENKVLMTNIDLNAERQKMLKKINDVRIQMESSPLVLDENASKLAQFRSEDMVKRSYFAHETPDGKTIGDFAFEYDIDHSPIGENIAQDMNTTLAFYGLTRSPAHLQGMLGDFTHVGIGVSVLPKGGVIVVQVFH